MTVTVEGAGELWKWSARQLAGAVRSGSLPADTVLEAHLARIAERESTLHSWAWHAPSELRRQARPACPGGVLQGVPYGIKDIFETAGMPTDFGAPEGAFRATSLADSDAVTRLRSAGAMLVGKTVTAEFAYAHPGPTLNPHDPARTPGGSSSGSAAAVAAGMVPFAIGSQSGGSTIRPSAYCGIVGFKPSHGVVSTAGMKALAPSLDTVGIHTRDVADAVLVFSVLSARDKQVATLPPSRVLRVGVFAGPHAALASPASQQALATAARFAKAAGIEVFEATPMAAGFADLSEAGRTIMAYEAALSLAGDVRRNRSALRAATLELIARGQATPAADYQGALALVDRCRQQFVQAMAGCDAWMTFSAPGVAPPRASGTGDSVFNRGWTAMGGPCITLPCPVSNGTTLPLGIQLVAPPGADAALLEVALQLERAFVPKAQRHDVL